MGKVFKGGGGGDYSRGDTIHKKKVLTEDTIQGGTLSKGGH